MKKKILTLLLAICLILLLPIEGRAVDIVDRGQCGDNLTWTLTSDCVLTISGTGDMWDIGFYDVAPWDDYRFIDCNDVKCFVETVVIEDGVTSIGDHAFRDCGDMIKITLPNSVTRIGVRAFGDCIGLSSIDLPESLVTIDLEAFANCENLESIVIPGSVKTIGEQAFFECTGLKEMVIPESVEFLATGAFIGCTNLCKIQLSPNITEIAPETFAWCESLTKITIPNGVTKIGSTAFGYCSSLASVDLPDSLTYIDTEVFKDCEALESIVIPDGVTEIGFNAFENCISMTSVELPESLTCIGSELFKNCEALESIVIPDSVETAGDGLFTGVTATVYYPMGHAIWNENKLTDYGGDVTWVAYCLHKITEIQKKADPTCTEKGYSGDKVCAICGEVLEIGNELPAKGHTEAVDKAVAATCEETGLTEGKHCSVCNAVLVKQETIPAKGHSFGEWKQTKAPTCTEKGTETRTCACGKTENRDVAPKGHTEVVDKAVDATCEETGLTEGKHCSVCNAVTVKQETVPAKGHNWDGGKVTKEATETAEGEKLFTCTACKQTKTEIIPTKDHIHKYTDAVTAPTCTEKGYTTHTCACGHSYTDIETAAKGHSWDEGTITIESTEEAEGVKTFTCSACGETKTESIPKLSHTHKYTDKVTAPTCTAGGHTTHTCACGHSYTDIETAAKGHSWDEGTITIESTEEAEGVKTFTCSACGETKTESIPKLSHTHKYTDKVTAPTCTAGGYTTHTCVCGHSYTDSETAALGHSYSNGKCTVCGTADPDWAEPTQPTEPEPTEPEPTEPEPTEPEEAETDITRLAGSHRYETAFLTADQMKINLGIEKFDAVVVASGVNFADALSGSYLAAVKNAPILLACNVDWINDTVKDYIRNNLNPGGTVYILGGAGAVPAAFETGLDGFTVKRLAGGNRFETNLMVLEEAGIGDKPVLVCTGLSFADSLSASATELPILLVWKELTTEQKELLAGLNGNDLYVIGGESAVSTRLEEQIAAYGITERVQGNNRFETSIAIAEHFFYKPESVVLAYAWNFPDGLCGGALAVTMKAPLILTMERYETRAAEYVQGLPIAKSIILGGEKLVPESTVNTIFP